MTLIKEVIEIALKIESPKSLGWCGRLKCTQPRDEIK